MVEDILDDNVDVEVQIVISIKDNFIQIEITLVYDVKVWNIMEIIVH